MMAQCNLSDDGPSVALRKYAQEQNMASRLIFPPCSRSFHPHRHYGFAGGLDGAAADGKTVRASRRILEAIRVIRQVGDRFVHGVAGPISRTTGGDQLLANLVSRAVVVEQARSPSCEDSWPRFFAVNGRAAGASFSTRCQKSTHLWGVRS